jgi:hypothetical protein
MKFRDGMWLAAEGKRLEYAEEVYSTTRLEESRGLRLLCPTKKIHQRADTLNLSTLTIVGISTPGSSALPDNTLGHRDSFRRRTFCRNHTLAGSIESRTAL